MKKNLCLLAVICAISFVAQTVRSLASVFDHGDLKVSPNHRFLMYADGTPFFYLGDTAWELFHRLTLEESERYLDDRAGKRFNVIQAVVLAEFDGLQMETCRWSMTIRPSRMKPISSMWMQWWTWHGNEACLSACYRPGATR